MQSAVAWGGMTEILHGRFEVLRSLGGGSMGVVVEARDLVENRNVALKMLRATDLLQPELVARFRREAQTMSRLRHPNIVEFRGFYDPPPVLVLELLEGESLRALLRRERALPAQRACAIALELAGGLAAAHAQGVVHRDIKPSNLFLTRQGVAKLIDFGVAKETAHESAPLTAQSAIIGSALYMAPEQIRGEQAEARSDLFVLGLCLFEMITGERPFADVNPHQAMVNVLQGTPLPEHTALPAGLHSVLLRATSLDKERRYQRAEDFTRALQPFTRAVFRTQLSVTGDQDPSNRAAPNAVLVVDDPTLENPAAPESLAIERAPDSATTVQPAPAASSRYGTVPMPAVSARPIAPSVPNLSGEPSRPLAIPKLGGETSPASMTRPLAHLPAELAARAVQGELARTGNVPRSVDNLARTSRSASDNVDLARTGNVPRSVADAALGRTGDIPRSVADAALGAPYQGVHRAPASNKGGSGVVIAAVAVAGVLAVGATATYVWYTHNHEPEPPSSRATPPPPQAPATDASSSSDDRASSGGLEPLEALPPAKGKPVPAKPAQPGGFNIPAER